jgi:BirA family biotin operon repressor/biotin-[acetyl-CoA-carboxylase] ligase
MDKRQSILDILQKNEEAWISGEQISSSLGISRTAVWKNINFLRDKGYEITSSSKLGYKFLSGGKGIDEYKIKSNLKTRLIGQNSIFVYETTDSTNREAFKLASQGISEGSIVIAENQSSGKGRLGRSWKSFPGQGIYLSIILRPPIAPSKASGLTIAAAVALSFTLDEFKITDHEIKWPNDILINGRKVSGILTEMKADPDSIDFIITGIGINLNIPDESFPDEIKDIAVSVSNVYGAEIDRCAFLQSLLCNFEKFYFLFLDGGFPEIINIWKKRSEIINKKIRATLINESFTGTVTGINSEGFLIVDTDKGVRFINSGDIHYI